MACRLAQLSSKGQPITAVLKVMSNAAIYSTEELFKRYSATVMLAVLIGDFGPSHALRLAGELFERFPALFPGFAEELVESGAKAACWSLAALLKELPGSWTLYVQARDIAAA